MLTQDKIKHCLTTQIINPFTNKPYFSLQHIKKVVCSNDCCAIDIETTYPMNLQTEKIEIELREKLASQNGPQAVKEISINWQCQVMPRAVQKGRQRLPGVRNTLAIASGKGGVGKSTTAVNLALALCDEGARVGILDADIYGPSIPALLGVSHKPEVIDNNQMKPIVAFNLQLNSIGFLVDSRDAIIWRGPMATNALVQLATHTAWDDLDYLIIDMPPGTGDIQLTLSQRIPVSGAVIVTTPQDIALLDALRGAKMFEKVNIPVLGIIENMSYFQCPHCGHAEAIFGAEGAQKIANELLLPVLGHIPLTRQIREQADLGLPISIVFPNSDAARNYSQIAHNMAALLDQQPKDYSHSFPPIVFTST